MERLRVYTSLVTALFGVAFALIANLALLTSLQTAAPWFSSTVSLQVYSITLVLGSLMALILAVAGVSRAAHLEELLHVLDVQIPAAQSGTAPDPQGLTDAAIPSNHPVTDEMDESLGESGGSNPEAVIGSREEQLTELLRFPESAPPKGGRLPAEVLQQLAATRDAVRAKRERVWPSLAGPIVMSILFVGMACAMLPGSEGFGLSHFRLNTTLILFVGYGWPFFVLWMVVGLWMAHRG